MSFDDFYNEYCVPKPVDPSLPTVEDKFMAIMQACFDKALNLEEVIIVGTTPSFNDGDPCYHSSSTGYKLTGKIYYDEEDGYTWGDPEEMQDEDEDEGGWIWDDDDLNNGLESKVWSLLSSQNLDEDIWYTNYKISITRGPSGKIVINHESHHPEY
jgi:hypothetical protein